MISSLSTSWNSRIQCTAMRRRRVRVFHHLQITALLCIVVFQGLASAQVSGQSSSSLIAITRVTVIDATGSPPKRDMTVLIKGRHILAVGAAKRTKIPPSAQILEGGGKFLIPGLWDMHVHTLSKGLADKFFPLFIANGITGVRDMGGDIP